MDYKCSEGIIRGKGIRRLSGRQPFFIWSVCGAVEGGSKGVWGEFYVLIYTNTASKISVGFSGIEQTGHKLQVLLNCVKESNRVEAYRKV